MSGVAQHTSGVQYFSMLSNLGFDASNEAASKRFDLRSLASTYTVIPRSEPYRAVFSSHSASSLVKITRLLSLAFVIIITLRTSRLMGRRWSCFDISRTLVAVSSSRVCDMPSSSAAISSMTRSMLTASSKRWWKKQGDWREANFAAAGALAAKFMSDRATENRWGDGTLPLRISFSASTFVLSRLERASVIETGEW